MGGIAESRKKFLMVESFIDDGMEALSVAQRSLERTIASEKNKISVAETSLRSVEETFQKEKVGIFKWVEEAFTEDATERERKRRERELEERKKIKINELKKEISTSKNKASIAENIIKLIQSEINAINRLQNKNSKVIHRLSKITKVISKGQFFLKI